jgi:hypothetical protein
MIIFATYHDESTAESMQLAKSIIEENDIILLKEDATRLQLLPILKVHETAQLMVFSHGKERYCLGNDDIPALTTDDIALLAQRKVFVYACWTAVELGKSASSQPNCLYAGYNNTVITGGSDIPSEMQMIFQFIKNNFHKAIKEEDIMLFLNQLSDLCNNTEQKYLEQYPKSLDFIGISTALRNIWAKLEIWVKNRKYTHSEAIEPLLW